MEEIPQAPLLELEVNHNTGIALQETTKWTRFIAIVGVIVIAFFVIVLIGASGLIIQNYSRYYPEIVDYKALILFAVFALLCLVGYMVYLLLRFSLLVKKGVDTKDQATFNRGLGALKLYFIMGGILAILSLIANFIRLI